MVKTMKSNPKKAVENQLERLEKSVDAVAGQAVKESADIQRLTLEVVDMRQEMALLETKTGADRKFDLLMQAIDGLAAKIDAMHTEQFALNHGLNRHETVLVDHEKRIKTLEVEVKT